MTDTTTCTKTTCPHCQYEAQLGTFQLQQLLATGLTECKQCAVSMRLDDPDQLKRFEQLASTGMKLMGVVGLCALAVVAANLMDWLDVIRRDTKLTISVIATITGAITLLLAKTSNEFTFELQAVAKNSATEPAARH